MLWNADDADLTDKRRFFEFKDKCSCAKFVSLSFNN